MVASPSPVTGDRALLPRIRGFALALLGLCAPLAVVFAMHGWGNRAALEFVSGTVTGPDQRVRAVTLPFFTEHEPQAAKYRYALDFVARDTPRPLLRIIADDCVRTLAINGSPVPLGGIPSNKLCDYQAGFEIDVGRFLRAGQNHFDVEVENLFGAHALAISSVRDGNPWSVRSIVLFLLLVPACFAALKSAKVPTTQRWIAAVLLALAGWLRYHFAFDWHPPESYVFSDMSGYVERSRQVLRGQIDENHVFQPPGYTLALALSLRLVGSFAVAVWGHVLLGWATVALVWRASARWLRGAANLVVLAITALHVPFITLSGFFVAETFFTFQLALLFYLLAIFSFPWRVWQGFVLGLVFMSALWLKGNNTFFGPLVVAWAALWVLLHPKAEWRALARRVVPPLAAFCVASVLVIASHATFTYKRMGKIHLSSTGSALNFVEGKCPWKRNFDSVGYSWQSPLHVQLGENEEKHWPRPFTDDKYFWGVGIDCIRHDPLVLWTSLRYVYFLFFDNQLWPPNTSQYAPLVRGHAMLYSALLFPGMLIGAIVIFRAPRRRLALASLMALSIVLCSWIIKSELRYRVPFDVVFIPMGVIGWCWLAARLRRTRRPGARASADAPSP